MKLYSLRSLLLTGAALALWSCHESVAAPMAPLPPSIHVQSSVVEAKPMPRGLPLSGSLVANQQADVAANASGRVMQTFVERGAFVHAEAALAQLDVRGAQWSESEARANLANAEAQQQLAASQCARNQELFKKGAISSDEWERISNACTTSASQSEAAKARMQLATKNLTDATVRAPFSGMISERFVSRGEYVQPSTRVATLVELDPLRLQVTVSEADLQHIAEGQKLMFQVQSYPGSMFEGKVRYIGPAMRSNTRDLVVEALVKNADHKLRPGMFATVSMELADQPLPVVPKAALRAGGVSPHVFAIVRGRVEERAVQIGAERNGYVAILNGISAGDSIVTNLTADVKDGIPVADGAPEQAK